MFKTMRLHMDRLKAKHAAEIAMGLLTKPDKFLSFYTRAMTKATDSERCSVFIYDPARDKIWLKAGTGVKESEIEVPKAGSVVGDVIASGKPMIVADLNSKSGIHKTVDQQTGFVTRSILCVPIKSATRNETIGAFQILNKNNNQKFTDEDLSLAEEIAEHLQWVVDRFFLEQEVFGLSEQLYSTSNKIIKFLLSLVAVAVLLIILVMLGWLFVGLGV